MTVKRVAVIGCGSSGLGAMKGCLEEGLEPVGFERIDEVGGLWRYTEKAIEGQSGVQRSTVINTSKEMTAYSDFVPPKDDPNFMHNKLVWKYFSDYAKHFRLTPLIRYNTEVKVLKRADDFIKTGRWIIESFDHKSGEKKTEVFDAVMICTGHHAEKNIPSFPGIDEFQGEVFHTHEYRVPDNYVGKRVLVIGIGNSGGDLAVELSRVGEVILSTRRGFWLSYKSGADSGMPWDIAQQTRFENFKSQLLPYSWNQAIGAANLNERIDHDLYRLTPEHMPMSQHPLGNDELGYRIVCGGIKVKGDIKRFTKNTVIFDDGTEEQIDAIGFATGYVFGFPFAEKEVVEIKKNKLSFYKYMFPPDLEHSTLAVIGFIQPLGAIIPIAEMQCRLTVRVFKGLTKLPSRQAMWEDIRQKEEAVSKRYVNSTRHTIQVDWIPFMDELAEMVGCKPNVGSYLLKDPILWYHLVFGGCVAYQYRLEGPHKWSGARQAILGTMERVKAPLQTRSSPYRTPWSARLARSLLHPAPTWSVFLHLFLVLVILYVVLF